MIISINMVSMWHGNFGKLFLALKLNLIESNVVDRIIHFNRQNSSFKKRYIKWPLIKGKVLKST